MFFFFWKKNEILKQKNNFFHDCLISNQTIVKSQIAPNTIRENVSTKVETGLYGGVDLYMGSCERVNLAACTVRSKDVVRAELDK